MNIHSNAVISDIQYPKNKKIPEHIETAKFELRRIHNAYTDNEKIYNLFHNEPKRVFKYCGWNRHQDIHETKNYYRQKVTEWDNNSKYEYIIVDKTENQYIGTTYIKPHSDNRAGTLGLWLRKDYWGQNIQGYIADIRIHLCFHELDIKYIDLGCLKLNEKSIRGICSFVKRYNGTYYGSLPVFYDKYNTNNEENKTIIPHHEFYITDEQYLSRNKGINTDIPNTEWSDIELY